MSRGDKGERQLGSKQPGERTSIHSQQPLGQRSQQPMREVNGSSQPRVTTSQAAPPPKPPVEK